MYFNFYLQPLEKLSDDNTKKLPPLIESVKKMEIYLEELIEQNLNEQTSPGDFESFGERTGLRTAKDLVTALIKLYQNSSV